MLLYPPRYIARETMTIEASPVITVFFMLGLLFAQKAYRDVAQLHIPDPCRISVLSKGVETPFLQGLCAFIPSLCTSVNLLMNPDSLVPRSLGLLDHVREVIRGKHYSAGSEKTHNGCSWSNAPKPVSRRSRKTTAPTTHSPPANPPAAMFHWPGAVSARPPARRSGLWRALPWCRTIGFAS